jgi:hypothetical protein
MSPMGHQHRFERRPVCPQLRTTSAPVGMSQSATRRHAAASLDHLVGDREQVRRHIEAEQLCRSEIDDEIKLGRSLHRQIAGLGAFENPIDIRDGTPKNIGLVRCVAHQPAVSDRLAKGNDGWESVHQRLRDDLAAMHSVESARRGDQAAARHRRQLRDRGVDLGVVVRAHGRHIERQRLALLLERAQIELVIGIVVGIEQKADPRRGGRDLLEQAERLADHRIIDEAEARDIAAGVLNIRNVPLCDGVVDNSEHDRIDGVADFSAAVDEVP